MNHSFNVVDKRWIPVVRGDGCPDELGIIDVLIQSQTIAEIRDGIPSVEFGIHRLLIAILIEMFRLGQDSIYKFKDIFDASRFDPETVVPYLNECRSLMDILDPERPFLQTKMDGEPEKPLAGLLPSIPSGTNTAHFHHHHEDAFGVSPVCAARLLTTIAPFMTAGGAGLSPSINGAPPWYVLIRGKNLFETLCFNMFVQSIPGFSPKSEPAWRRKEPPGSSQRRTETGLLEALTWRPRRIQLIPGRPGVCAMSGEPSDVLVRTMRFGPGDSTGIIWRDPNVPYRHKDGVWLAARPQAGREVWRETGPLAFLRDSTNANNGAHARPRVIDQFVEMNRRNPRPIDIVVYGMRTDLKMKVFEWQREALNIPFELADKDPLAFEARDGMERAENARSLLRSAIRAASRPRSGGRGDGGITELMSHAERGYWGALRSKYDEFLKRLAKAAEDEAALREAVEAWNTDVKKEANDALDAALKDLDSDADALERVVRARAGFRRKLAGITSPSN